MRIDIARPAARSRTSSADLALFLFFSLLYTLTASGHIERYDGNVMFAVTGNIVRAESLSPRSAYGPMLSLVAVPFYLAGWVAARLLHFPGDFPIKAAVSFTNAFVSALTCVFIVAIARRLGMGRAAYALALIYGTCTLAWPYAKTFFSEPLTGLWLLLAFWALLHVPAREGWPMRRALSWVIGAFVALSLAFLTRETTLIALPPFAAYAIYLATRARPRADRWPLLVGAGATIALGLVAVGAVNVARFGRAFSTGYTGRLWTPDVLSGLYGLLIGPYKGLFLFVPLTVVAFAGWPQFCRRRPPEALLCAGVFLVYLVIHAAYIDWPGGGNWGPRFLVPALPFLLFALPFGWARSPRWTVATLALGAISLAVQLPAVYVSYARYYPVVGTYDDMRLIELTNRHPLRSPIVVQWRSVPVVTAQLRDGLRSVPGARTDLARKEGAQVTSALPPAEVLRRSITVNVPDFWFVYLSLGGHLTRALRVIVGMLGIAWLVAGVALVRALRPIRPARAASDAWPTR